MVRLAEAFPGRVSRSPLFHSKRGRRRNTARNGHWGMELRPFMEGSWLPASQGMQNAGTVDVGGIGDTLLCAAPCRHQ
jgi:hypothetical protein